MIIGMSPIGCRWGEARSRRARRILSKLSERSLAKKLQIYAIYVRSGRNTTADFPTRASDDEIAKWGEDSGAMRKENVRFLREEFAAYGAKEMWGKEEEETEVALTSWNNLQLVEWGA